MSVIDSRVVNIDELKLEHFAKGDKFESRSVRISRNRPVALIDKAPQLLTNKRARMSSIAYLLSGSGISSGRLKIT